MCSSDLKRFRDGVLEDIMLSEKGDPVQDAKSFLVIKVPGRGRCGWLAILILLSQHLYIKNKLEKDSASDSKLSEWMDGRDVLVRGDDAKAQRALDELLGLVAEWCDPKNLDKLVGGRHPKKTRRQWLELVVSDFAEAGDKRTRVGIPTPDTFQDFLLKRSGSITDPYSVRVAGWMGEGLLTLIHFQFTG